MPPEAADLDGGQLLEQLTAIRASVDDCRRYLGGIYGILQQQEGLSSTLSDLGPMVMAMLGGPAAPANGSPGPHTHHPVIEAQTDGN